MQRYYVSPHGRLATFLKEQEEPTIRHLRIGQLGSAPQVLVTKVRTGLFSGPDYLVKVMGPANKQGHAEYMTARVHPYDENDLRFVLSWRYQFAENGLLWRVPDMKIEHGWYRMQEGFLFPAVTTQTMSDRRETFWTREFLRAFGFMEHPVSLRKSVVVVPNGLPFGVSMPSTLVVFPAEYEHELRAYCKKGEELIERAKNYPFRDVHFDYDNEAVSSPDAAVS